MKLLQFLLLIVLVSPCLYQATSAKLRTLVAPVVKHDHTSLFSLKLNQNQQFLVDITTNILLSSCPKKHPHISCLSKICNAANSYCPDPLSWQHSKPPAINRRRRICHCTVVSTNSVSHDHSCFVSELTYTNLTLSATDGRRPTTPYTIPRFVSACAQNTLLRSLPTSAFGLAGMGRSPLAMPTQLAASLHSKRQFALCLPSTTYAPGVAFFGDGPFFMMPPPGLNLTTALSYTPLVKNPTNPVYYINVKAIAINGALALNFPASRGLVKLSTVAPYTVLKTHLYRTFIHAFAMATSGIPQTPPVKPFDLCLNTTMLGSTRVGLPIPQVDLMLANGRNWTMFGVNSMKQVSDGVACLAVVDGEERAAEAAVIGSHQLQDNFLLFDLERSRLGFSSTLSFFRTSCSNFNF